MSFQVASNLDDELSEKVLRSTCVHYSGLYLGSNGKRYPYSLCAKEEKLAEALERIKKDNDQISGMGLQLETRH